MTKDDVAALLNLFHSRGKSEYWYHEEEDVLKMTRFIGNPVEIPMRIAILQIFEGLSRSKAVRACIAHDIEKAEGYLDGKSCDELMAEFGVEDETIQG